MHFLRGSVSVVLYMSVADDQVPGARAIDCTSEDDGEHHP